MATLKYWDVGQGAYVVLSGTGPAGVGVPAAGTTNQVLVKRSNTDYDTTWSNYPVLPLPTSSSTLVSFTDPSGEVWVAKSTVNSGNWARARDVLFSWVGRNAAYTCPAGGKFAFDTQLRDVYGLWVSPSFTVPFAGLYEIVGNIVTNFGAAGQGQALYLSINSGQISYQSTVGRAAEATLTRFYMSYYFSAADTAAVYTNNAYGISVAALGIYPTWATFRYLGTG